MSEEVMSMWTIYDHPTDHPDFFVARRWVVPRGGPPIPTKDMVTGDTLESLRRLLRDFGLISIGRCATDDPVIVETWL